MAEGKPVHSILNSKFPVLFPYHEHLLSTDRQYEQFLLKIKGKNAVPEKSVFPALSSKENEAVKDTTQSTATPEPLPTPYKDALLKSAARNMDPKTLAADNKTFTDNADIAFISTKSPLVDLFYELTETAHGKGVEHALAEAWAVDSNATLKIIFNARSIHLGKASKTAAYSAFGWLYKNHPQTFLANIRWLARPLIEKKVQKEEKPEQTKETPKEEATTSEDDDFELISATDEAPTVISSTDSALAANSSQFDVKNGVAHGYWKDILNMLALAVNDQLHASGDFEKVLNFRGPSKKRLRNWSAEDAKDLKQQTQTERYNRATKKFNDDVVYQAFHITVARLFASQLRADSIALQTGGKSSRAISLAAKWAPSFGEFHDKHTFVVSSIAEILHRREDVCPQIDVHDRELYLKHARLAYRNRTVSPLRKFLDIVERNITAETFDKIKYERVPSLAMDRYQKLFIEKDTEHFSGYLQKVASGDAKVSGAVLLPSTLVSKASGSTRYGGKPKAKMSTIHELASQQLLDGQWNAIVKRLQDSGTLESSIAVCDVSGSMSGPQFKDGTCPMDSAIGLSLLLAEIVKEPFGGCFITFSESPTIQAVGGPSDKRSFKDKVEYIMNSQWGMNTDFVAVFEKLILPLAVKNNLKQEDMVKQIFVFSDMQFDQASSSTYGGADRWTTSFERIQMKFKEVGYDTPTLVFWNLAGGARGYGYEYNQSKPVEADTPGVTLVSGYSQGQMKMFLDGGKFEELGVEEEVKDEDVDEADSDEGLVGVSVSKKQKIDPNAIVRKAISHPAYQMLRVID